eukprot:tig00000404_g373.t1
MAVYAMPGDYTVVLAFAVILAFLDAYGIGANDVANNFANAVGAKTISLRNACILASFAEFLGALLLGKTTGETIRGGLIKVSRYADHPTLLMLAMQCALIGSSSFILIATRFGMAVSTTHAIVGAVIGTSVAAFGGEAVNWNWEGKGVAQIIASWFISPALAFSLGAIMFLLTKFLVLRRKNSFFWGLVEVPVFFAFALFINTFLVTTKGMPKMDLVGSGQFTEVQLVGVSWAVAIGASAILSTIVIFWAKRVLDKKYVLGPDGRNVLSPEYVASVEAASAKMASKEGKVSPATGTDDRDLDVDGDEKVAGRAGKQSTFKDYLSRSFMKAKKAALHGVNVDVVSVAGDAKLEEMHEAGEDFDPKTEDLFKFLQIVSSTMNSFAHGSNDVANAVGPLATVYAVWQSGSNYMCDGSRDGRCWAIAKPVSEIDIWILAFGGAGIVIGLSTYGYNIMRTLGNHLTKLSPARGFCIELGAATTVVFASSQGWPVSTTHCAVGATTGVGAVAARSFKGAGKTVNWRLFAKTFLGWVVTLPCAGLTAALIFAYVSYTPAAWATEQQSVVFFPNTNVNWGAT